MSGDYEEKYPPQFDGHTSSPRHQRVEESKASSTATQRSEEAKEGFRMLPPIFRLDANKLLHHLLVFAILMSSELVFTTEPFRVTVAVLAIDTIVFWSGVCRLC